MDKIQLITTGLKGLVGSKFAQDFADKYDFLSLDLRNPNNPVDITNYESVIKAFSRAPEAKFVFHLAAFTDVTKAWQQRDDKNGLAYQVNVVGTKNIVKACKQTNKHLIHVSTAYVFNGKKEGLYLETDPTSPIEWYGQTKTWAEEAVTGSDIDWTILRIDQPFRSDNFAKLDIAHRSIVGLKNNNLPPMFINHYFGPTYIDDFAKVVDFFIRTDHTGLFHASSGEQWTDYKFASLIKKSLELKNLDDAEAKLKLKKSGENVLAENQKLTDIKQGNLSTYLKTLNRPYQQNTAMNCDKLKGILDFKMKSVQEAMEQKKLRI